MWVYYNLFQPVLHLTEKVATGTRITRKWDTAQTPLRRLLATEVLTAEQCAVLEAQRAGTNPRALRQTIYGALRELLQADPAGRVLVWAA